MAMTVRQRQTHPMSYYMDMVKDMDNSQKLQLIAILAESVKLETCNTAETDEEEYSLRPYTMEEIDAMLDEAEAAFEAGDYLMQDEVFRHKETLAV